MNRLWNDGGRIACGLRGHHDYSHPSRAPGDCVCRSISIVADLDYRLTRQLLLLYYKDSKARFLKHNGKPMHTVDRYGVATALTEYSWRGLVADLGFTKIKPTDIGIKRVRDFGERHEAAPIARLGLPWGRNDAPGLLKHPGRFLITVKDHMTAVMDGDHHDLWDCTDKRVYRIYKQTKPHSEWMTNYLVKARKRLK